MLIFANKLVPYFSFFVYLRNFTNLITDHHKFLLDLWNYHLPNLGKLR